MDIYNWIWYPQSFLELQNIRENKRERKIITNIYNTQNSFSRSNKISEFQENKK